MTPSHDWHIPHEPVDVSLEDWGDSSTLLPMYEAYLSIKKRKAVFNKAERIMGMSSIILFVHAAIISFIQLFTPVAFIPALIASLFFVAVVMTLGLQHVLEEVGSIYHRTYKAYFWRLNKAQQELGQFYGKKCSCCKKRPHGNELLLIEEIPEERNEALGSLWSFGWYTRCSHCAEKAAAEEPHFVIGSNQVRSTHLATLPGFRYTTRPALEELSLRYKSMETD